MPFRAHGPEPCASAYSATRAQSAEADSAPRVQGAARLHLSEPYGK